ncbi:MAG: polymerase III, epsilon subunit protein [Microgenomates group bacterium GW2011_GWA2_44_7]|nr:MAG: polymerase III, epsilon subunit protein [Microgenomates group bacterium GW2011_GWA2_44_7]KKT77879.1 MAG: polymerase III, epsilon subunit protein [Microgenomates group bacterium GW2011_GWB1_44_8]
MDDKALAFVDLETTGISSRHDRIIELAVLKVQDNKIQDSLSTLVNPEIPLPPFIEHLTGITRAQLEQAPTFAEIKDHLVELFEDTIFVAHNARFDYWFIKEALKRHGISLSLKQLCTVKLFRALHPKLGSYNLDSLISAYKLKIDRRHRAWNDAKVLFDFYLKAKKHTETQIFQDAINKTLRRITTPVNISGEELDSLPEGPGVYIFFSESQIPLYIGKSINIKDRVLSHFADTGSSVREVSIAQQVKRVETFETAGELSALLLESTYIKRYKPLYNRQLRRLQRMIILKSALNSDGYQSVYTEISDTILPDEIENIIGIYRSEKQLKDTLMSVAKDHQLCPKLLGLSKDKAACFWCQLGWCRGACINKEPAYSYNVRFIEAFAQYRYKKWPFAGPVLVHESSDRYAESIIVDKWCVLGSGRWDEDSNLNIQDSPYSFDVDTYKILVRFFSSNKNYKKIRILDAKIVKRGLTWDS